MKAYIVLASGIALGVAASAGYFALVDQRSGSDEVARARAQTREPLYWVAPMDASYRRSEPGKSPMGMDLVPVYADSGEEGLVRISPAVVHNLGVRVEGIQRRTLSDTVRSVGHVRYDEELLSHVHPRVSGWVERLFVKSDGARVEAGAPLYTLYSPQLVSAQEELSMAVQRGAADLIAASEERLQTLQIPAATIRRLRDGGGVERTVTFRAVQAGVVDKLNIREGFFVEPGTTLMSIGALDSVWVEVEVFERDAYRMQEGLPARMTLPYLPGREWVGEVDYIYPTLDAGLRTLTLRLRFSNSERTLKPNMFAEVAIETPPVSFLALPREAVIRIGDSARVVVEETAGVYRSVPVHLGRIVGKYQEVLHGLSPGDRVVTSAQFLLDSESSKSSGLARMENPDTDAQPVPGMDVRHDHGGHGMPGPAEAVISAHDHEGHESHEGHEGHDMSRDGQNND